MSTFRLTVDFQPKQINWYTGKQQLPMPNIDQQLGKLVDSFHFARIGLTGDH